MRMCPPLSPWPSSAFPVGSCSKSGRRASNRSLARPRSGGQAGGPGRHIPSRPNPHLPVDRPDLSPAFRLFTNGAVQSHSRGAVFASCENHGRTAGPFGKRYGDRSRKSLQRPSRAESIPLRSVIAVRIYVCAKPPLQNQSSCETAW